MDYLLADYPLKMLSIKTTFIGPSLSLYILFIIYILNILGCRTKKLDSFKLCLVKGIGYLISYCMTNELIVNRLQFTVNKLFN